MQQANEDRVLSFGEATKYLDISEATLNVYISSGKLVGRRDGTSGDYIFYESELADYRAAHPRGRKPNLAVVKEDSQLEQAKDLTIRTLLDYVTRSHVDGKEVVKVTIRFPEYEYEGKAPYNTLAISDPDMQAFFAQIPVGQEFEMVLRKKQV